MTKRTIPKVRKGRISTQGPPIFLKLMEDMGFNPGRSPNPTFQDWNLDQTYPPTVGELLLPNKIQEETDDPQDGATAAAGETTDPGGSGQAVPGESEDGDPVGAAGQDRSDQDPRGTSQVP